MGHTNSTANLSLPQFISTDKPTWLGDINGAFSAIDSYAGTNDAAVAAAVSDASSAISQAASAVSTATTANTTAGNASTAATNAVGTANNAMSLVNQTNTKIGTLANLHTTDKTSIVDAINEIKDAEGDLTSLTTSDKTSLVAAINEINQGGGGGSVSVTADGVKTVSQLLDALYALIDQTKVGNHSYVKYEAAAGNYEYLAVGQHAPTAIGCICGGINNYLNSANIKASGSTFFNFKIADGTNSDISSSVPTSGLTIEFFY